LEALRAREAVRPAGVEDHRAHRAVGDDLLRPDDRVRLRAVAREHRGGVLPRPAVDDEGEVGVPGGLQADGDPGRLESRGEGGGSAHGATPFTGRPSDSGRPSARLADWMAAPAVPFTRLSRALTTTTRPARSSTARPTRQVFAPV